jgi:hypothetical protein
MLTFSVLLIVTTNSALFQPVKAFGIYSRINFSDSNQTEMKTEILESISDGEVL